MKGYRSDEFKLNKLRMFQRKGGGEEEVSVTGLISKVLESENGNLIEGEELRRSLKTLQRQPRRKNVLLQMGVKR